MPTGKQLDDGHAPTKLVVLVGPAGPELRGLANALEAADFHVRRASTLGTAVKRVTSAGIVLQATVVSAPPELSQREREVQKLEQLGLGNREIAHELAITEGSVKVFRRRAANKTKQAKRTTAPQLADR